MEARLKCGSCTHMKSYIDHPKYGQIEIHYGKNAELIEKLIIELWEQDHTTPYATCELGYLEEARRRSELSEKIVEALRARNFEGETYAQMEKASGVSGSYIHSLANHQCDPIKMSLEKFLALFPSARIELAPACASSAPSDSADFVPRSEYQDLRDRYQDLRDRYQDLRDELAELKSARPPRDERPLHPYRAEPALSTSSPSNK